VSLIVVNNIIVVTYWSKCHRLSLSLIAVNGITLMDKPYQLSIRMLIDNPFSRVLVIIQLLMRQTSYQTHKVEAYHESLHLLFFPKNTRWRNVETDWETVGIPTKRVKWECGRVWISVGIVKSDFRGSFLDEKKSIQITLPDFLRYHVKVLS
jgi:hypothetical protein